MSAQVTATTCAPARLASWEIVGPAPRLAGTHPCSSSDPAPSLRFPSLATAADYQSWEKVDPVTLFDAPTLKAEANPKARV